MPPRSNRWERVRQRCLAPLDRTVFEARQLVRSGADSVARRYLGCSPAPVLVRRPWTTPVFRPEGGHAGAANFPGSQAEAVLPYRALARSEIDLVRESNRAGSIAATIAHEVARPGKTCTRGEGTIRPVGGMKSLAGGRASLAWSSSQLMLCESVLSCRPGMGLL